jgi:hypothetical protein
VTRLLLPAEGVETAGESQSGSLTIPMEDSRKAVLVISSAARGTAEPASYRYELTSTE